MVKQAAHIIAQHIIKRAWLDNLSEPHSGSERLLKTEP
jgi:hypothetical protein